VDLVYVRLSGTLVANRPLDILLLTVEGRANGSFVGLDSVSSRFFESGDSWDFDMHGIITTSRSTLSCDVEINWTSRATTPTTTTTTTTAPTTTGSSGGTCRAGLVLDVGDRCTYPGTREEFWVDSSGRGRFSVFTSGQSIELRNAIINGVTYTFVASKQSDGTWLIEEAG